MTDPSFPLGPIQYAAPRAAAFPVRPRRVWLHVLLFALTIVTTLAVGAQLAVNYRANLPAFDLDKSLNPFSVVWGHPELLLAGLPFALTLLGILLAHEMGHYLTCRYYGIDATLPFFIPAPTIIGTMGAFIKIRSPIFSKRALFDVGVSGPLAGFVIALPVLVFSVAASRIASVNYGPNTISFGTPLLVRGLEWLFFPGVSVDNIYLNPVARAAWVGLFATALNLLPIGQLDGGHILYAMIGERQRRLSRLFVIMLLPLAYYWWGWAIWAVVLFFLGMKHPMIHDYEPLDESRRRLGIIAFAIFAVCFTPAPFIT